MLRYLLLRPIGVLLSFAVLTLLGVLAWRGLPISLLPSADVPQIVVKVNYPNVAAATLENEVIRPLRESFLGIKGIEDVESVSNDHRGMLTLFFAFRTPMDLTFVEVNERIDRLVGQFPRDLPRPQATRINTSDVPIIRLQLTPVVASDLGQVASLAEKVVKRRLEQLEGVSVVDLNGVPSTRVRIELQEDLLRALGVAESTVAAAIQAMDRDYGDLSIREGNYRYFVKISNGLVGLADLERLPIRTATGLVLPLSKLATFNTEEDQQGGFHVYNGRPSIGLTIQKQADARMNELVPEIKALVGTLQKSYPSVAFTLTQDQTYLLRAGIDNLRQDLIYGGAIAILILFLFLRNYGAVALMSLNIPLSLIITLAVFQACGVSLNILSLSGLALGIGMLIDNSIIVLDSITRQHRQGLSTLASGVRGVADVFVPVLSQVLTTVAVYAPLILLPGLAGLLVFDQAVALTISLGVSLLVAFLLTPVLYRLLLADSTKAAPGEDTRFYRWILGGYHRLLQIVFRFPWLFLGFALAFALTIGWTLPRIPLAYLPQIEQTESLLRIDWQAPVTSEENLRRIQALDQVLAQQAAVREAEVGIQQYLLQPTPQTQQQAQVYYACSNQARKKALDQLALEWLARHYPLARVSLEDAPNAFSQLFAQRIPFFAVKLRPYRAGLPEEQYAAVKENLGSFPLPAAQLGPGLTEQRGIQLLMDANRLANLQVDREAVDALLQRRIGGVPIVEREGLKLYYQAPPQDMAMLLQEPILNRQGQGVRLAHFMQYAYDQVPSCITADKAGPYFSLYANPGLDHPDRYTTAIRRWANERRLTVQFVGQYFSGRQQAQHLWQIFLLSLLLLYFILALQFEQLLQPLLVMLTLPLGVAGALLLLYALGGSLDVMAAIGFVVVLGIIVDDPILKVEVINRLRRQYQAEGYDPLVALDKALHTAGDQCLKPLLMTSLTTSLALTPVLFSPGLGADLQKPLVLVIMGGLTLGTFFTTWFIPLAYRMVARWLG